MHAIPTNRRNTRASASTKQLNVTAGSRSTSTETPARDVSPCDSAACSIRFIVITFAQRQVLNCQHGRHDCFGDPNRLDGAAAVRDACGKAWRAGCACMLAGVGGVSASHSWRCDPWWAFALPLVSAGAFGLWGILERATAERGAPRSASYDRAIERRAVDRGRDRHGVRDRDRVRGARDCFSGRSSASSERSQSTI